MRKICVLGGGRQGSVVAADLSDCAEVTVYDLHSRKINGVCCKTANLSDYKTLVDVMSDYKNQVVVGALPAELGFQATKAAIEAGCHYIDMAFYKENAYDLHSKALSKGVVVVSDCGFAPGISNLIVGNEIRRAYTVSKGRRGHQLTEIHVYVGGFSVDPNAPYGYVTSWSLEDLQDEYIRPARIVMEGKVVTVPALSDVRPFYVDGIGELEAFYTDGLRTLLDLKENVPTMTEKTLRRPGHVDQIRPLVENGTFIEEIREKCSQGRDIGVLVVDAVLGDITNRTTVISRAQDDLSAMARATALTCSTVAKYISENGPGDHRGVTPLECVGNELGNYIMNRLEQVGLEIKRENLS